MSVQGLACIYDKKYHYSYLQMYTPYSELSATFFGFNLFKELDQSLDLIYLLVPLPIGFLTNKSLNELSAFRLRVAKVHILFLITKFILKNFNLFLNKLFSSLLSTLQPQLTGCKCIDYFFTHNSFLKFFFNNLNILCKVLILWILFF